MNYWTKVSLGIAACAAMAGAWYADDYYTKKEADLKVTSSLVLNFESEKVRKIIMSNASGKFAFERDAADSTWKMTEPKAGSADQESVNQLMSAIKSMKLESSLTEQANADTVTLANFGLDKPVATLELHLEDKTTLSANLGKDVSIGAGAGDAFTALSVYGSASKQDKVLVIGSAIMASTKKTYADFRSKQVAEFKPSDVKTINVTSLENGNSVSIRLAKADKDWKISIPRDLPGDNNNIGLYLEKISKLKADKVTEQELVTPDFVATSGIANPGYTLELFGTDASKALQTVKMSLNKTSMFVKLADGAVGTLDLSQWADLTPTLKYLRDKRVLRNVSMADYTKLQTQSGKTYQREGNDWYPLGAVPDAAKDKPTERVANKDAAQLVSDWEFMTADEIIDGPEAANLTTYGLATPLSTFTLAQSDDTKPKLQLLIGSRVPKNEKLVYVKRADTADVMAVESGWVNVLATLNGTPQTPTAKK